MNKKLILGLGILGLAALGLLYVTNKNKKAKSDVDSKAKADAAEKKRQEDLARMNDPERKKLYDDIYLGLIKFLTDKINANYDRMIEMSKGVEGEEDRLQNFRKGELVGVNGAALKWWNERLDTFNKMSIDEIKLLLMVIKEPMSIQNDPFLFRQVQELVNKYPNINIE